MKRTRLEVVSLQSQLKNKPSPEPSKPIPGKSKPIDPWVLGIILIVAVGMLWILNKPSLEPKQLRINNHDLKS